MGGILSVIKDNSCTVCCGTGKYPSYVKCYKCYGTGKNNSIRKSLYSFKEKLEEVYFSYRISPYKSLENIVP